MPLEKEVRMGYDNMEDTSAHGISSFENLDLGVVKTIEEVAAPVCDIAIGVAKAGFEIVEGIFDLFD
jgi:hypothetical protein